MLWKLQGVGCWVWGVAVVGELLAGEVRAGYG